MNITTLFLVVTGPSMCTIFFCQVSWNEQSIPQIGRIQFEHLQCCSESFFESPTSTKVTGFPKDLENFQEHHPSCGRVTFFRESTFFDTRFLSDHGRVYECFEAPIPSTLTLYMHHCLFQVGVAWRRSIFHPIYRR